MVSIDFISLPKEVHVPADWAETPALEARVDRVAQSYFSDWQDASLDGLHTACAFVGVSLAIGIGVSIYFVSIPSIVLCSAGLIICLIGDSAIRREQILRCQNVCLELERWCQQFKEVGDKLKEKIEPFVKDANDQAMTSKDLEEIVDLINALSENNLKERVEKLEACHRDLFVDTRTIGQGTWSSHWISHFNSRFCSKVTHLYICTAGFKKCMQDEDNDEKQAALKEHLEWIYEGYLDQSSKTSDEDLKAQDTIRKVKMWLLSNRLDVPEQGQESFATMMEEAEYWRQNIAIFRSSLTQGPNRIR